MVTKIRPRKDGGFSECSSPDELVGKGRCCHILGDGDNQCMEISKIKRGLYEVKVDDNSLTINGQKEVVINFFNSLSSINEDKIDLIVDYLSQE